MSSLPGCKKPQPENEIIYNIKSSYDVKKQSSETEIYTLSVEFECLRYQYKPLNLTLLLLCYYNVLFKTVPSIQIVFI